MTASVSYGADTTFHRMYSRSTERISSYLHHSFYQNLSVFALVTVTLLVTSNIVSDIAIFVLKRDVKLQLTNQ